MNALEVRGLDVWYGAIHALHDVSIDVPEGQITTLLGANGAGKTTLLRTLSGLLRPRAARNKRHDRGADSAGHSHRLPPRLFLS